MAISAELVKKLREATGAGMMECKAALEEAVGDFEKAIVVLRKKGAAAAGKKADRITSEGVVYSYLHPGGKVGVLGRTQLRDGFRGQDRRISGFGQRPCNAHRSHGAQVCPA